MEFSDVAYLSEEFLGRALLIALRRRREFMVFGIGVLSLVTRRLLSRLMGKAGLMVVAGLMESLLFFLEVMVGHVCLGTAGGGARGAGGLAWPAGGGGGVAVWIVLRRKSLSGSATLVVSLATFSTRTRSMFQEGEGVGCYVSCLTSLSRYLTGDRRVLIVSLWSSRVLFTRLFILQEWHDVSFADEGKTSPKFVHQPQSCNWP